VYKSKITINTRYIIIDFTKIARNLNSLRERRPKLNFTTSNLVGRWLHEMDSIPLIAPEQTGPFRPLDLRRSGSKTGPRSGLEVVSLIVIIPLMRMAVMMTVLRRSHPLAIFTAKPRQVIGIASAKWIGSGAKIRLIPLRPAGHEDAKGEPEGRYRVANDVAEGNERRGRSG
jgi:hypothetical protein